MVTSTIYRIGSNLQVYESRNNKTWKKSIKEFPEAINVAKLFKQNKKLDLIKDPKDKKFLKGYLIDKHPAGARVDTLPDGTKLDKAYPLLAPNLNIHDESSHGHWDVIFKNPNGKFTYIYTQEKSKISKDQKYKRVDKFSKILPKLKGNLTRSLGKNPIALPIIILLETKMRVGSERYYKENHHKGLTTLKPKDIKIKGDKITFEYIAKGGVPQKITKKFSPLIIKEMAKLLRSKKPGQFVFTSSKGRPLKDTDIEKAIKKYSGAPFYPHIVRSNYATQETKKFIKQNKHPTKNQAKEFYLKIAEELGHKKFSKKTHEWQDSFQVTLSHYIKPELVEKISKKIV